MHFDRIADRRAGTVRLDVGDTLGGNAGALVRFLEQLFLSVAVGDGQTGIVPVGIDGRSQNQCLNRITVRLRRSKRF